MKVLTIQLLHFLLPDDFDGDLSDALRLLADYHDDRKGRSIQRVTYAKDDIDDFSNRSHDDVTDYAWDAFQKCISENKRVFGMLSLGSSEGPMGLSKFILTDKDGPASHGSYSSVIEAKNRAHDLQEMGLCVRFSIGTYRNGAFEQVYDSEAGSDE